MLIKGVSKRSNVSKVTINNSNNNSNVSNTSSQGLKPNVPEKKPSIMRAKDMVNSAPTTSESSTKENENFLVPSSDSIKQQERYRYSPTFNITDQTRASTPNLMKKPSSSSFVDLDNKAKYEEKYMQIIQIFVI